MPATANILITGTGSLARAILSSLAEDAGRGRIQITILSRSHLKAAELATVINLKASHRDVAVSCTPCCSDWSATNLQQALVSVHPDVIIHTASLQSPWELEARKTRWALAVAEYGYGLTTALHAQLTARLATVVNHRLPGTWFINCCYPDVVGPLLSPVLPSLSCGAGNVSIVCAALTASKHISPGFRVAAHHAHVTQLLREPSMRSCWPVGWTREGNCIDTQAALQNVTLPSGSVLNLLTGTTIATLIREVLSENKSHNHVPAPNGLPGGYPVVIWRNGLFVDLNPECALDARSVNQDAQAYDGIAESRPGAIAYSPALESFLHFHKLKQSIGVTLQSLEEDAAELLLLRQKLNEPMTVAENCA
jgi:hypothetical protein